MAEAKSQVEEVLDSMKAEVGVQKIRLEVLDWSMYHAAAAVPAAVPTAVSTAVSTAVPCLRFNISVAIDPRLSKSKIWNLWKKYFIINFFPLRTIRLIVNSFFV